MNLIDPIIQELQMEMATTRKVLDAIPADQFDYTPHEKSFSMRKLASHIVDALRWTEPTMKQDVLELDMGQWQPFEAKDKADLLATFDQNVNDAIAAMKGTPNEALMTTWTMKMGGNTVLSMPRMAVIRGFIISHHIHHRGQLTVYLRMVGAHIPQVYGPTADEPNMAPAGV